MKPSLSKTRKRSNNARAHSFRFAIYSADHSRYEDAVLRTGQHVGTPQEALDTACTIHLAGLSNEPPNPHELPGPPT